MISENIRKVHGTPMCFKTIAELEAYQYAEEFEIDDIIHLLGVVSVGDGLGHARKVSLIDDTTGILLTDGRYANIVPNSKLSDKANKAVQIIAGKGLTGGGTIGDDVNLSIVPANDSMVVTENDVQVNTADDLVTESSTRPLSAKMGKKLATEKINFTDIVNDLTTGGVNKVPSAETVKLLKQLIDAMGSGGAAQLAYQLKSAEKSRIPSYGTLNAGGSVIVASSGIIVDPNVFINGELLNPDEYTINKQDSTITLKTPVKYQAIYFIDDTYAPKYKFSVSTVNFLVNAPTLKSKLALGDVVDIQGESDAYDGGHHVRVVENTSKLNGVDLGGGLFLNEVPNSRPMTIVDMLNTKQTILSTPFYSRSVRVPSSNEPVDFLDINGNIPVSNGSFYIKLCTRATAVNAASSYVLNINSDNGAVEYSLFEIFRTRDTSSCPKMIISGGVPKIATDHPNTYEVVYTVQQCTLGSPSGFFDDMRLLNRTRKIINLQTTFPENIDCTETYDLIIYYVSGLPSRKIILQDFLLNAPPGMTVTFLSRSATNSPPILYGIYYKGLPNNTRDTMYTATATSSRYDTITLIRDASDSGYHIVSNNGYNIEIKN